MKPTFKKTVRVVLVSFVLLLSSCENDSSSSGTQIPQATNIQSAKKWFDAYEDKGENIVLMQNLDYNWNDAQLTKSEDGTETIIVPVNELKKDQGDLWEQKLYIYKLDEDRYTALLFEAYSNKNIKPESQSVDGGDFTGYITVWDLKKGFVRGAKFLNNQVVEEGVAEFSIDRNKTNRAPETGECIFSDLDDGCHNDGGDGAAIPLREVIVKGPSTGTPVIYTPRGPVIGGTTPGGYTSPGGGGGNSGGGGITAPTNAEIAAAIQKKINADKLDACTKAVLDKLKNLKQANIAAMIQRFNSGGSIFNINMSTGQIPDNNSSIWAQTTPMSGSSTDINMVFNQDYINGKYNPNPPTDLSVATTMAHEIIHAYLISQLQQYKSGEASGICDFPTVYDAFVKQKISSNPNILPEAQHELIASAYVNAIASTIEEFQTGQPVTSGYPKQVYLDMAWGGLITTAIFTKNYPNDPNHKNYKDRERIMARINTEKLGSIYGSNMPIGTPCKK